MTCAIYTGLPSHIDLGLNEAYCHTVNSSLCVLFFVQHSLMIRKGFRTWLSGSIPTVFHGAVFSIISAISLLTLMLFWQKSTFLLLEFDGPFLWAMRGMFFLCIIAFYITYRSLRPFDPLGIREILFHLKERVVGRSSFVVRGAYRWVRHPLYCIFLLIIWSPVTVTSDRLLFNGLWTVWIIVGTIMEERDMIASFGDEYRKYQRNVPMLMPFKGFTLRHYQKY